MTDHEYLKFRDFALQEGQLWDAVRHGVRKGFKAYKDKRVDQKRKSNSLIQRIMSAEGEELKDLVKQMVDDRLTVSNGKVVPVPKVKTVAQEVFENAHVYRLRARNQSTASW